VASSSFPFQLEHVVTIEHRLKQTVFDVRSIAIALSCVPLLRLTFPRDGRGPRCLSGGSRPILARSPPFFCGGFPRRAKSLPHLWLRCIDRHVVSFPPPAPGPPLGLALFPGWLLDDRGSSSHLIESDFGRANFLLLPRVEIGSVEIEFGQDIAIGLLPVGGVFSRPSGPFGLGIPGLVRSAGQTRKGN